MEREHLEANRTNWDERVDVHVKSDFYDRAGFVAGKHCPLQPVDLECVGDVEGKTLVHLQCHFGMDTLAWARRGARVTGLDFSPNAIEAANTLARDAGLSDAARFVESDVHDAVAALDAQLFDIVFVNVGAISWLPRVEPWARVVASLLAPAGRFYMREAHPMLMTIDEHREDGLRVLHYPYFEHEAPIVLDEGTTYGNDDEGASVLSQTRTYAWSHGLGETVTALIRAGLVLERLDEHQECDWKALPDMEKAGRAMFRLKTGRDQLPLTFSLLMRKPG